jgi:hypothetical protein
MERTPWTHSEYGLKLCLEVGGTNGPNRNQIYGIPVTTARDMRSGCSVSIVGTPQFSPRKQSLVVKELVQERIATMMTNIRAEMEARYEEKSRKQWEEMMTHFSTHYPPLQTSMRFFSPSTSTSTYSFNFFLTYIDICNWFLQLN